MKSQSCIIDSIPVIDRGHPFYVIELRSIGFGMTSEVAPGCETINLSYDQSDSLERKASSFLLAKLCLFEDLLASCLVVQHEAGHLVPLLQCSQPPKSKPTEASFDFDSFLLSLFHL